MLSLHINMTAKFIYDINRKILMEFKEFMVASIFQINSHFCKRNQCLKINNHTIKFSNKKII